MSDEGRYVYSTHNGGDPWNTSEDFATREEAVEEAGCILAGGTPFYTGRLKLQTIPNPFDFDNIREHLTESVAGCWEIVDDDLSAATAEQMAELETALNNCFKQWLARHGIGLGPYYLIRDVEEHAVPELEGEGLTQ